MSDQGHSFGLHTLTALVVALLTSFAAVGARADEPPMRPLPIEGFAPALLVPPVSGAPGPKPVVVFLHGINADVAEQCGQWREAAVAHGWLLCIRGTPQPGTTAAQDRWTHRYGRYTTDEIDAALDALEALHPDQVTRDHMVLAGYSRGAILAPGVISASPGRYSYLFLAHGGLEQLEPIPATALRRYGLKGVAVALSNKWARVRALAQLEPLERAGLKTVYVHLPGAGHAMGEDFPVAGRAGMLTLTEVR